MTANGVKTESRMHPSAPPILVHVSYLQLSLAPRRASAGRVPTSLRNPGRVARHTVPVWQQTSPPLGCPTDIPAPPICGTPFVARYFRELGTANGGSTHAPGAQAAVPTPRHVHAGERRDPSRRGARKTTRPRMGRRTICPTSLRSESMQSRTHTPYYRECGY